MTPRQRRRALMGLVLAGLMLAMSASSGCNLLSLPFFLLGPEPRIEASLKKIASKNKDKPVRVVVLVSYDNPTSDFFRADRDLSNIVAAKLKECCKYNDEKIEVVSASKVDEFKNLNSEWRALSLEDIGTHFEADYVIDLAINKMSLYETGSQGGLYRGRAEISITLCDLKNPDEGTMSEEFTWVYPTDSNGPVDVMDKPKEVFRGDFYRSIATQIAWHFTSHPTAQDFKQK
jgi:hypothetical protein